MVGDDASRDPPIRLNLFYIFLDSRFYYDKTWLKIKFGVLKQYSHFVSEVVLELLFSRLVILARHSFIVGYCSQTYSMR
jgi:hypothetical protein